MCNSATSSIESINIKSYILTPKITESTLDIFESWYFSHVKGSIICLWLVISWSLEKCKVVYHPDQVQRGRTVEVAWATPSLLEAWPGLLSAMWAATVKKFCIKSR